MINKGSIQYLVISMKNQLKYSIPGENYAILLLSRFTMLNKSNSRPLRRYLHRYTDAEYFRIKHFLPAQPDLLYNIQNTFPGKSVRLLLKVILFFMPHCNRDDARQDMVRKLL